MEKMFIYFLQLIFYKNMDNPRKPVWKNYLSIMKIVLRK